MSLPADHFDAIITGFPRVSGDEPGGWAYVTGADKFSPRERG